ncbi:3-isopropylmalate dehydrogenase [bacterium]|nr:MAG: 3-isopropylmalate dehydrogenase [bacterium]
MSKTYSIAVLPGDGIGPEVTIQSIQVLLTAAEKFGFQLTFTEGLVGAAAIDVTGNPYPQETAKLCKESDAILFGAIGHPKYDNDPNAKVRPEQGLLAMRRDLGLFANLRPVKTWPALYHASPLKNELLDGVDMVFVRELTGGIYFGEPRGRTENGFKAFDSCVYDKNEIERVSKVAFELAQKRRKKVTMVDKANVLATSRLWRETVTELAKSYPDVELDFMFVDNAAMQLIRNPRFFDVVLTENMFGDILSDEASMLPGSMGMLPSASIGSKVGLFEPIHGSYPQAAGKNIANPFASVLSAAMLLTQLGELEAASAIEQAVETCLAEGLVTEDLGGKLSTAEVGNELIKILKP